MAMYDTLTFNCDAPGCLNRETFLSTVDSDEVDAHFWLVGRGWAVGKDIRILSTTRTHFCPHHKE